MTWLQHLFRLRESANPDAVKPFLEHLEDLRWTLIKSASALVAGMAVALSLRTQLVHLLQKPLRDIDPALVRNLQVLGPFDSIIISFKLAFYAGIVLTLPFLLFFIAQFVLPALTRRERRLVIPIILAGFILFACGVCFSYFFILPTTLTFCFKDTKSLDWSLNMTATHYLSTTTHLTVALGLVFELPIAVAALNYLRILTHLTMRKTRVFAFSLLLALAAIIAPTPDPFTMLALGTPMCLLYEACIWLAWLMERSRARKSVADPPPQ